MGLNCLKETTLNRSGLLACVGWGGLEWPFLKYPSGSMDILSLAEYGPIAENDSILTSHSSPCHLSHRLG